jgi:hypothetical protein
MESELKEEPAEVKLAGKDEEREQGVLHSSSFLSVSECPAFECPAFECPAFEYPAFEFRFFQFFAL